MIFILKSRFSFSHYNIMTKLITYCVIKLQQNAYSNGFFFYYDDIIEFFFMRFQIKVKFLFYYIIIISVYATAPPSSRVPRCRSCVRKIRIPTVSRVRTPAAVMCTQKLFDFYRYYNVIF